MLALQHGTLRPHRFLFGVIAKVLDLWKEVQSLSLGASPDFFGPCRKWKIYSGFKREKLSYYNRVHSKECEQMVGPFVN